MPTRKEWRCLPRRKCWGLRASVVMSQLFQPFRRLHWQLTLTYVVITLVAALTIEAANVAGAIAAYKSLTWSSPDKLVGDLTWVAPQIAPYLDTTSPNDAALASDVTALAQMISAERPATKQSIGKNGAVQPNNPAFQIKSRGAHVTVAVLDAQNHIVAAAASDDITAGGADGLTQAAVSAALAGGLHGEESQFTGTLADGRTVAAVPLDSFDGSQVGLLVIAAQLQQPQAPLRTQFDLALSAIQQQDLLPSAFYFLLLASVIGTLSGLLASRSIRGRLRQITVAAEAWSDGDLDVVIQDGRRDELGLLAQDLNGMASQVQRMLTAQQELAVLEERHRLARDLHDSIKQQLFVVTMLVGAARADLNDRAGVEQTLADAEELAGRAQQELTSLIRALRPVALATKGLSVAIRELCAEWSHHTGIPVTIQIPDELPLSLPAEQDLFRVVQEALHNVARHSGATSVEALGAVERNRLILSVTDNGHGFDHQQIEQDGKLGIGLSTMRERLERLHGRLSIVSSGAGTHIEIEAPLSPSDPAELSIEAIEPRRLIDAPK
jgi:signal transduction histidine kinase